MRTRILPLLIAPLILAVLSEPVRAETIDCLADQVTIVGTDGTERARYRVRLADTPQSRARGLMFVETMPAQEGMLFLFDEVGEVGFWMRNTLIPLDMIFIAPGGRIATLHEGAIPHDETTIWSAVPVNAVLEVNAGEVGRAGIRPGDWALSPPLGTGCMPLPEG